MSDDFYYALIIGWVVLLIFWLFTLIFIYYRNPPKSKLTKKLAIGSFFIFLLILFFIRKFDSFFL